MGNARAAPPAIRTGFSEPYTLVYAILPQAGVRNPIFNSGRWKPRGQNGRVTPKSCLARVGYCYLLRSWSPLLLPPAPTGKEGKGVG